jgi:hypothetical protein
MWDLWWTKWHWGFFSEYFGFLCQFSFHQVLHIRLSSGAGTIAQLVADVPSGHNWTPHYSNFTRNSTRRDESNHKRLNKTAVITTDIRLEHLPITSLEIEYKFSIAYALDTLIRNHENKKLNETKIEFE